MSYFFVRQDGKYLRVDCDEICYIESVRNYIRIHTVKKKWLVLITLYRLKRSLPGGEFCQIHRSFIVRNDRVRAFDSRNVWLDDICLPIATGYLEQLQQGFTIVQSPCKGCADSRGDGGGGQPVFELLKRFT